MRLRFPAEKVSKTWPFLGFSVFALIVLLREFANESLWLDELASANFATAPTAKDFFSDILQDVHPPVLPVIHWAWGELISLEGELGRLSNSLAVLGAAILLLLLTGNLARSRPASIGLFLFPAFWGYLLEFRAYLFIIIAGFWVGFWCFAEVLAEQPSFITSSRVRRVWAAILISIFCATHYFGILLAWWATFFLFCYTRRSFYAWWFLLFAVLTGAWTVVHAGVITHYLAGSFWIQGRGIPALLSGLRVAGGSASGAISLSGLLLLAGFWSYKTNQLTRLLLCLTPAVLSTLSVLIISQHTPLITGRNLLPIVAFIFAVTCYGLSEWAPRWISCGAAAVLGYYCLYYPAVHPPQDWRGAAVVAAEIADQLESTRILVCPFRTESFQHYFRGDQRLEVCARRRSVSAEEVESASIIWLMMYQDMLDEAELYREGAWCRYPVRGGAILFRQAPGLDRHCSAEPGRDTG